MPLSFWTIEGAVVVDSGGVIACDECPCFTTAEATTSFSPSLCGDCSYQWDATNMLWILIIDDCAAVPECVSACSPPGFDGGCEGNQWDASPCDDPGPFVELIPCF